MKAPIAVLLSLTATAIIAVPASAITLTSHVVKPHGITAKADRHLVLVRTVAPPDRDDDGCANADDSYQGPGCQAPPEPVAPVVSESVAPAPVETSVPTAPVSTGYSIPSYIVSCESGGDYGAVNASSGAVGAYQIMPSTASAYGCDLSTPSGQDACAANIYADVGASAWSCG